MSATALNQLDRTARDLAPVAISFFIVLFAALPFQIPQFGPIAPNLAIMTVFYWGVHRPDRFPSVAAFALGIWQDVLVGTPLGLNAVILLFIYGLIEHQRRFFSGNNFSEDWTMFGVVALGAAILGRLLVMIMYSALVSPLPGLFQLALTILAFPFVTWFLARFQRLVLREA